jgi:2,5-diketo-D-gluconate reductase A
MRFQSVISLVIRRRGAQRHISAGAGTGTRNPNSSRRHTSGTARRAAASSGDQLGAHCPPTNDQVDAYDRAHEIGTQAWAPLAQGKVLDDPTLIEIAGRLGKSPPQVVLRGHIQRGNVVFPKSTTPARIKENFELFDFHLEPGDVEKIDALDRGEAGRDGPNPDTFAYIPD